MHLMFVAERLTGRLLLQKPSGPSGEVTGLDFSESMLEAGKQKVENLSQYYTCSRKCDGIAISR